MEGKSRKFFYFNFAEWQKEMTKNAFHGPVDFLRKTTKGKNLQNDNLNYVTGLIM